MIHIQNEYREGVDELLKVEDRCPSPAEDSQVQTQVNNFNVYAYNLISKGLDKQSMMSKEVGHLI